MQQPIFKPSDYIRNLIAQGEGEELDFKFAINDSRKIARIHKRLVEKGVLSQKERQIIEALKSVKQDADMQVLQNARSIDNETCFSLQMMRLVIDNSRTKTILI